MCQTILRHLRVAPQSVRLVLCASDQTRALPTRIYIWWVFLAAHIEAVREPGHLVCMLDTRTNARKKLVTRKPTLAIRMLLIMCAVVICSLMGRATWVLLTQVSNLRLPSLTRRT